MWFDKLVSWVRVSYSSCSLLFLSHTLRSGIYTIVNGVASMRLCVGSQNSSGKACGMVEGNDPSLSMMRYRESVLDRQDRRLSVM